MYEILFEIVQKEKIIELTDEILPPCWIYREINNNHKENNYFNNTRINKGIWVSGKDGQLISELKSAIDKANEIICISTYIFSEPEIKESLINASKRGVRVYIITASNKHLKNKPDEDDDFNIRMYDEMYRLFSEMQGIVKIRTSEHFHSKFLLIDPFNLENRRGFLLTANIDTKALMGKLIDGKFRVNPEICISLDDIEIKDLYKQFCLGFWEESTEESKEKGFYPIKKKILNNIVFENILLNSSKDKSLETAILDLIENNSGKIILCTYGIQDDTKIFQKLLKELEKGREIIILTRPRNKNMSALLKLVKGGAKVYGHDDVHAKVIIIENDKLMKGIIMTANIEEISFTNSFESGKYLKREEYYSLLTILNTWISNFPLELKLGIKKGKTKKEVRVWNEKKQEIERNKVIEEELINLPPLKANSIENYDKLEKDENEFKKPNEEINLYKKLKFIYSIRPPILPNGAKLYQWSNLESNKKILKKSKYPIFELDEKYFIVIKDKTEFNEAKHIAERLNAKIVTLEKYVSYK